MAIVFPYEVPKNGLRPCTICESSNLFKSYLGTF